MVAQTTVCEYRNDNGCSYAWSVAQLFRTGRELCRISFVSVVCRPPTSSLLIHFFLCYRMIYT
eukprot:2358091-Pyramimonas_sp.AAC.1